MAHYYIWSSFANMIIDILTLCLPIREVVRLQMSRSRKVAIISVFLFGSLCVPLSIRCVCNEVDVTQGRRGKHNTFCDTCQFGKHRRLHDEHDKYVILADENLHNANQGRAVYPD